MIHLWPWLALVGMWAVASALVGYLLEIDLVLNIAVVAIIVLIIIAAVWGSWVFLVYYGALGFIEQ